MLVWSYLNSSYDFWNHEFINPNTKCTGKPQSSISMHPFSDVPYQKYLNPQVRTNKLVNSVFYHDFPSRLASRIHPLNTYFFKFRRVLSLLNACWTFCDLYIPTCVRTFFNLWCSHSQKMHWIYGFLLMPKSPTQNSR